MLIISSKTNKTLLRVFGASVRPRQLNLFIPDRYSATFQDKDKPLSEGALEFLKASSKPLVTPLQKVIVQFDLL